MVSAASNCPAGMYVVRFLSDINGWPVDLRHALADERGSLSAAHSVSEGWIEVRLPATPGDSNGNGIPDAWEVEHFGQITNVSHTTDADRDGLSDFYEFLSRTDPRDASSCLSIDALDARTGLAPVLRWYSIPGASYRVEIADELRLTNGFSTEQAGLPATPPMNVYTAVPPAGAPSFFRVVREP